jgi:hypothetical protein
MFLDFDFALGKSRCPDEFTEGMRPEQYRGKSARHRPLGRFIPNSKFKLREQVAVA